MLAALGRGHWLAAKRVQTDGTLLGVLVGTHPVQVGGSAGNRAFGGLAVVVVVILFFFIVVWGKMRTENVTLP